MQVMEIVKAVVLIGLACGSPYANAAPTGVTSIDADLDEMLQEYLKTVDGKDRDNFFLVTKPPSEEGREKRAVVEKCPKNITELPQGVSTCPYTLQQDIVQDG